MYQKFDRKTDYAKAVVNLHNKRVLLVPDPVSKSTLLLCTINKNEYVSKYYLQFSYVVCKIYLDRGSCRSAAGEFTYKCIPTVKKQIKKGRKKNE